jgi:hypothetical protein
MFLFTVSLNTICAKIHNCLIISRIENIWIRHARQEMNEYDIETNEFVHLTY